VLIEDQTALEKLRWQTTPRRNEYARGVAKWVSLSPKFMAEIGRLGAAARVASTTARQRQKWAKLGIMTRLNNSTARQRSAWAKKAVTARWRKGTP
jgi:hypothetical protein